MYSKKASTVHYYYIYTIIFTWLVFYSNLIDCLQASRKVNGFKWPKTIEENVRNGFDLFFVVVVGCFSTFRFCECLRCCTFYVGYSKIEITSKFDGRENFMHYLLVLQYTMNAQTNTFQKGSHLFCQGTRFFLSYPIHYNEINSFCLLSALVQIRYRFTISYVDNGWTGSNLFTIYELKKKTTYLQMKDIRSEREFHFQKAIDNGSSLDVFFFSTSMATVLCLIFV